MDSKKPVKNILGLKEYSEKKKRETFEKVDKAITALKKKKKPINFESVANETGLTRATLYNNQQIKERILGLRDVAKANKILEEKKNSRSLSDEERIKDLRNEITRMKEDKNNLVKQLVEYEELKQENQRLRRQLQMI